MSTLLNVITLFLVATYTAAGVFTANQEGLTQKTLSCFGLAAFFLCLFIYKKIKKWYDVKINNLKNVVAYLRHLSPIIMDDNKFSMVVYLLDLKYFAKNKKTLTGFFWIKTGNRVHSKIIQDNLNSYRDIDEIVKTVNEETRTFIVDNLSLFSKDVIELNAMITEEDSFKLAANNGLIKWF